jgi:predicted phosphodiesterase
MLTATGTRRFRALFISDVHLGAKGCQAERLLDFLRDHDADVIYLVGDIVDGWQLRSGWYWPQAHNDVVQKLLRQARKGVRIIYLPGNHDEFLHDYYGTHFGGVEVQDKAMHESADGRRYLIIHGDRFDLVADLLVADEQPGRHAGMGRHQASHHGHHGVLRRGDAEDDLVARVVEVEGGSQRLLDIVLDAADRTHEAHGRRMSRRAPVDCR